jgi:murein L,D-transpeptidase YcbB/YkuD
LPEILRDPNLLEARDLEVVSGTGDAVQVVDPSTVDWSRFASSGYRLRQRPGPRNPLGTVKFMFPNAYAIYLHDTPAEQHFRSDERTFSHGCVRVEEPAELAEFVLRGTPGWDRERIRRAMVEARSLEVALAESVPVHIVYWTAWVEDDGSVQFRDDVYGLDRRDEALP